MSLLVLDSNGIPLLSGKIPFNPWLSGAHVLDRLDEIEWSSLSHAYGEASDVPVLIRDLLSPNKAVRDKAMGELFSNVWHQGTVYAASVEAISFLIELLGYESLDDRDAVVLLVASIITGRGFHQVHSKRPIRNPFTGETIKEVADLDSKLNDERKIVEAIRSRGVNAIPFLVPYLHHHQPDFRRSVIEALARFHSEEGAVLPALEGAVAQEEDEGIRGLLWESIDQLGGKPA